MVAPVGSCTERNGLRQRDSAVFGTCAGGIYSQCGDDPIMVEVKGDTSILKSPDLQECKKLLYAVAVGVACAIFPV